MQDDLSTRKAELQQEYNSLALQALSLNRQRKACRERMAQLRGAFAELEALSAYTASGQFATEAPLPGTPSQPNDRKG
ncbi:MAG TPA: hypothetical protein IAD07_02400 [Candidatus Fimivicinus intestinavium]|nr:hypothetical protein [Candidatus Fimivicinus intestinavium]